MESGKNKEGASRKGPGVRDRMSTQRRAKQFMPFSAVSGLESALRRKEREFEEYDTVELVPEAEALAEAAEEER